MDEEPKGIFLPIAIAGGAILVCCLGPVLFVSGASAFTAWLGGINPLLAVGTGLVIGAAFMLFRRMRKSSVLTETNREPTTGLKGDQ